MLGQLPSNSKVLTYSIPYGDVGSLRTLQIMKKLVNDSLVDPVVINTAHSIVKFCPPKDEKCYAYSIFNWLKEHTQFIRDPAGVELIRAPKWDLDEIAKKSYILIDCDDFAVLAAALGKAVGMQAKFVVLGFFEANAPLTHVYTILKVGGKHWVPIDLKIQYPIARAMISRKEFFNV